MNKTEQRIKAELVESSWFKSRPDCIQKDVDISLEANLIQIEVRSIEKQIESTRVRIENLYAEVKEIAERVK